MLIETRRTAADCDLVGRARRSLQRPAAGVPCRPRIPFRPGMLQASVAFQHMQDRRVSRRMGSRPNEEPGPVETLCVHSDARPQCSERGDARSIAIRRFAGQERHEFLMLVLAGAIERSSALCIKERVLGATVQKQGRDLESSRECREVQRSPTLSIFRLEPRATSDEERCRPLIARDHGVMQWRPPLRVRLVQLCAVLEQQLHQPVGILSSGELGRREQDPPRVVGRVHRQQDLGDAQLPFSDRQLEGRESVRVRERRVCTAGDQQLDTGAVSSSRGPMQRSVPLTVPAVERT